MASWSLLPPVAGALLICSLVAVQPVRGQSSSAGTPAGKTPPAPKTASRVTTSHLVIEASASDESVAPGSRLSLVLEITPRRRIHVYGPGATDYRVINLKMAPAQGVTFQPVKYPPPEIYEFEPLNERIPVYQGPFQIIQSLTVDRSPAGVARLRAADRLIINGTLSYQACDDRICFAPVSVPLSWTLSVK